MSLLSTASPWISNEPNKKRTSSFRKTIKIRPYTRDIITEESEYGTMEGMSSLEDVQNDNENRSNRVNDILNQMSNVSPEDD